MLNQEKASHKPLAQSCMHTKIHYLYMLWQYYFSYMQLGGKVQTIKKSRPTVDNNLWCLHMFSLGWMILKEQYTVF